MDIVEEIRNDREKGARRLESEYRNGLRTLALRFCDDPGDADELVNRTFAEVVANIDNYAEQSAFFGWMCKILVHLHSKDVRRKEHDGIVYPGTLPDIADADAEEAIFRNLDASLLRDAIETLPADIRKTLLLHYFMEMPVKDVARFLAIPSGTVMWRLHYARQMLAAKLGAVAKKPGVRALLIALAIGATAALGAAVVAIAGARQQAYDSKEAGQQADNGKEADEPSAPRQDADVGGMPDTSASPIGDIGNIGNTAGSGDSPPTTPPTQEPTMKSTSLLLATPLAALTLASSASDFIWMDSPADANWNLSSPNWNSGEVYAPSTHWLMGMQGTGGAMLSVSNNGEFAVGTLRLGQGSSWPNSVHLSKGGTLRAGSLTLEFKNNQNVAFNFDGGRFQSVASQDAYSTLISNPTNEKWAGVHFYVREGGAILDSTNGKHLWWGRPLESGAASDGGLTCVIKSGKSVVLCDAAVCTYNGPTRVEGSGQMQVRVANGLPATTTLQIGPNTQVGFNSSWSAGHDLDQTVARVEGIGTAGFNTKLVVTGGVSPVFDGAYGPLTFNHVCSLSGTYDIVGDANGCGRLKVAADQDISGLALSAGDMAAMDMHAPRGTYPILDAPNGYAGRFTFAADFPKDKWDVRYTATAAYLVPVNAFVVVVR